MTRLLQQPPRDSVPKAELAAYDAVVNRIAGLGLAPGEGQAGPYFGALLNSPSLAVGVSEVGRLVRTQAGRQAYTDAERELVDMVLSHDLGSNAVAAMHIPDALACGVPIETIYAIREDRVQDLAPDEAELVSYVRQVVDGTVDDASFSVMRRRFGDNGVVEFTVFIAFLLMTIRLWQALDVPEPTDSEVTALLAGFRDGATQMPDPKARIG